MSTRSDTLSPVSGRRRIYTLLSVVAALVAGVVFAGCGAAGSGAASGLDPAAVAPADSLGFVSFAVRPQGAERSAALSDLTKLIGQDPQPLIDRLVASLLRPTGDSYASDVQPWLGQQLAVAVTEPATAGVAVITPTTDPGDATTFMDSFLKHAGNGTLTKMTYDGVSLEQTYASNTTSLAAGIVDHYAVVGGMSAFRSVVDAAQGKSLLSSASYASTVGAVAGGSVMRAYVNLKMVAQLLSLSSRFSAMLKLPGVGAALAKEIDNLPANAALGMALSMPAGSIHLDFDTTGLPSKQSSTPASVAGLPSTAWLALASGGLPRQLSSAQLTKDFESGFDTSARLQGVSPAAVEQLLQQRLGFNPADIFGALGPFTLEVSGSSILGVTGGLQMTPSDPADAAQLLAAIYARIKSDGSLLPSGGPSAFTLRSPTGSSLNVSLSGGKLTLMYGLSSPSQFLSPASTLASSPGFKQASAQLTSGDTVPFYLDFDPIASLLQIAAGKPGVAKVARVLDELSYLIVGRSAGHTQIVLGLH
jgi:uncharacterized protein DUF3352